MSLIRNYKLFLEAQSFLQVQAQNDLERPKMIYKPNNLVKEICICMVLINNQFLDNLLDRGQKARYNENSSVFLTDLKNLLLGKNRLKLGKFEDETCVADGETSKVNNLFETVKFSIEDDWNDLIEARVTARNIIDKLLLDQKLTTELISAIYWLGPNKTKDFSEDIVIELNDGRQFSFYLNKNFTGQKTAAFNKLADDLIGLEIDRMFSEEYLPKWDKLIQNWIRVIYENANRNIQIHIEKFIEPSRIDTIGWFEFFDLKHRDPRFKHLGEHIQELNKNILKFSDLLNEVWKKKEVFFKDSDKAYRDWNEKKVFLLNSKILEHLITESLVKNNRQEITKLQDGFKSADGKLKMKLIKTIVEKLECQERPIYYLGNSGNNFNLVPTRQFFRDVYDDLSVKFDYHVKLVVRDEEEDNNFKIKLRLEKDSESLIDCVILVGFSGGEVSSKLNAKYKFTLPDNFNSIITDTSIKKKD